MMTAATPQTDAGRIAEMRSLLAALKREAVNRGQCDMAELIERTDAIAADLLRQRTKTSKCGCAAWTPWRPIRILG
ncbi:MAG: hypothetical protein F8N15_00365 [Methanobacterium sp.]|nr:hypothetical protein [Methanobacterium sp.]